MLKRFLKTIAVANTIFLTLLGEGGSAWATLWGQDEVALLDRHLSNHCKVYDSRLENGKLEYDSDGSGDDNQEFYFAVQDEVIGCKSCERYWEEQQENEEEEQTISVSARDFFINGNNRNINEFELSENTTAVTLFYDDTYDQDYDNNNETKVSRLNRVLKTISQNSDLIELTLRGKGEFDKKSIEHISKITGLNVLSFDGVNDVYCTIYSPWKALTNLTNLNLEATRFAAEPFTENFKKNFYRDNRLAFHKFLKILPYLKKLRTLNLSSNDLFPSDLTEEDFGRPREKFPTYRRWRKERIESCAILLARNFKGTTLYMRDNDIGETFITKFGEKLMDIPNSKKRIMDFSDNRIPIEVATEVVLSLKEKKINFDFSNNPNGNRPYSNEDLKNYILEQVMGKVTLVDL
ncbi:MAG: hypothetical protein K2P93_05095 [Alphaproteobacteria bacterium]|nr:hypothetical protein [Alphaproteobacteria bacterium]